MVLRGAAVAEDARLADDPVVESEGLVWIDNREIEIRHATTANTTDLRRKRVCASKEVFVQIVKQIIILGLLGNVPQVITDCNTT